MSLEPIPLAGPVVLRIAADALRGPTDYADDHIWELVSGGEPPALAMETAFGRRAVGLRVFPSFGIGGPIASDPQVFARPPLLEAILPSYMRLSFSPLAGLDVVAEVRVQDSQTLSGRLTLVNTTDHFRPVRLGLHGQLRPLPGGQGMLPRSFSGVTTLAGRSADLEPVVFLSGGAIEDPGATSALIVRADLAPGAHRSFTWAEAALRSGEESFAQAKEAAARPWDSEVARLERLHGRWVEVQSGNPEWDSAFHFAQQSALNALVGPGILTPLRSLVLERTPERGYSVSGDGRDYDESWVGPSALEAYFIVRQLLPAAPDVGAEVLRGFWNAQTADGAIDARPGPAGQRARTLCPPILATLTLRVHDVLQDDAFLAEGFRALWPFFRVWFSPPHDRDGDGWPEWDHAAHPPWPLRWSPDGETPWIDTTVVEDPALLALLYREAASLEEIARRLGRGEIAQELVRRRGQLRALLPRAWSEERGSFVRIERETHRTSAYEVAAQGTGPGNEKGSGRLREASRLSVHIQAASGDIEQARVRIRGRLESGRIRVETLNARRFRRFLNEGSATTDLVFAAVETVEVRGIPPDAAWTLATLDLDQEDLTLLLPLWAGMVEPEQARRIVETMMRSDRYLAPGGLRLSPLHEPGSNGSPDPRSDVISVMLNTLMIEALVRYGYRREAADVLDRLMTTIVAGLREAQAIRHSYDAARRTGLGPRHHAAGLPPLSGFLDVLGVSLRSPTSLEVAGESHVGEKVNLRWRGLEVEREPAACLVTFPSGVTARVRGAEPMLVETVEGSGHESESKVSTG